MTRTTASYASVPPFVERIESLANGPALDEQRMRDEGTAELHDDDGVVFGVADWRPGPSGERWYAKAVRYPLFSVGVTVKDVTRRLRRKIEERTKR